MLHIHTQGGIMKKLLYPLILAAGFCALMFGMTTLFHSSSGACPLYDTCASCYPTMCDPNDPCHNVAVYVWADMQCDPREIFPTCASCYPTMCEPNDPCYGPANSAYKALHCGNNPC